MSQSRELAAAAWAAGDDVRVLELEGADHMTVIDPGGGWQQVVPRLAGLLAG